MWNLLFEGEAARFEPAALELLAKKTLVGPLGQVKILHPNHRASAGRGFEPLFGT